MPDLLFSSCTFLYFITNFFNYNFFPKFTAEYECSEANEIRNETNLFRENIQFPYQSFIICNVSSVLVGIECARDVTEIAVRINICVGSKLDKYWYWRFYSPISKTISKVIEYNFLFLFRMKQKGMLYFLVFTHDTKGCFLDQ